MSKDMLGIAVRKLVTLQSSVLGVVCDLLEKLADEEWVTATKRFLRKENPWVGASGVVIPLLTFVRKVRIDAQPSVTTSENYFWEARISLMDYSFRIHFLRLEIPSTEEVELSVYRLEVTSVDGSIIEELGGKEKAEISVSQLKAFLADNHESLGWFVAYLRDGDGELWAVNAYRSVFGYGWSIEACLVDDLLHEWDSHNRYVLSH